MAMKLLWCLMICLTIATAQEASLAVATVVGGQVVFEAARR
jgi:hypothetical protein